MSIFSKIGKSLKTVVKKVGKYALPAAAIAAPFIPGLGGAITGGISKLGGIFSAKDGADMSAPNTGPQPEQVTIQDSKNPFTISAAMPAISAGLNYMGQRQTNEANAQQAQKQMDFQEQQTSTSYQRGVEDMKKAGLNPLLAYAQGGAASGGGAQATMGNEIGEGANSAFSAMMTMQQLDNLTKQGDYTDAQVRNVDADTANKIAENPLYGARLATEKQRPANINEDTRHSMLQNLLLDATRESSVKLGASAAQLKEYEALREKYGLAEHSAESAFWSSKIGKAYPYISRTAETVNSAVRAMSGIRDMGKPMKPQINRRNTNAYR